MNFADARSERPLLANPPRGLVLVIASRVEDAVLGLGGTLALHAAQGDPLHVLVMHDVAPALPLVPVERGLFEAEIEAPGQLEPASFEHCGLTVRETYSQDEIFAQARLVARRIVDRRPTSIYAPWHGEVQPAHFAASHASALAVELADFEGQALGYEVRTPLVATLLVDVSSTWEHKRRQLEAHARRLGQPGLPRAFEGLAAHRGLLLENGGTHGEAFSHLLDLRIRVPHQSELEAQRIH